MDDAPHRIEILLRGIADASVSLIYATDLEGRFVFANRELEELFGVEPGGLIGKTREGFMPAEACVQHRANDLAVVESGQPLTIEETNQEPDGVHTYLSLKSPLRDSDGSVFAIAGISTDVTLERRAEELVERSEALYRELFDRAPIGYQSLDADGRFITVNEAWVEVLGYSAEEVVGRWFGDLLAPEYVPVFRERFPLFKAAGAVHSEFEMVAKDRQRKWVAFEGRIGLDAAGAFRQTHCVLQDITERRRSQAELEASRLRFSTLFQTSPDAILITHLSDGRCLELNVAFTELTGYSCDELKDIDADALGFRDNPSSRAELSAILKSGQEVRGFEARLSRKNGTAYTALISAKVVEIDGEQCVFTAMTDISELAAANERVTNLSRVYAVLSGINQALVHIREPRAIFDEACRVIVEEGGFRMAWVGLVCADGAHVEHVAWAGAAAGYLESVDIVLGDQRRGTGPAARAISGKRHVVCRDIEHDQTIGPWRENALDSGFSALASFPLTVNDRCVGALTIYSEDSALFDDEQIALLDELAGDISFSLVLFEREEVRRRAEARHRSILRTAMDGFWLADADGRLLEVNETYCEMSGYSEAELLSMRVSDLEAVESKEDINAHASAIRDDNRARFESRHRRKDGSVFEVESSVHYEPESGNFAAFQRDITERKLTAERLAKALIATTKVVSLVTETRDPYTAGHQRRVSQLSAAVAAEMRMPEDQVEEIRLAGLIHDVGKISIPAEILSKPGKLSPTEFELIKGHSEAGHLIIAGANMEGPFAEIVYQHHERCDGSGYPRGLTGDQLLPGTKVIMVADVVEAMASHRPYRAALGIEAALAEIECGAGSRYDAEVARACARVFDESGFEFSE